MNFDSSFQENNFMDFPSPKKEKIICEYDDCSKIFKSKKTLKDHLKIHKGEKPYSCTFFPCDKAFTQYSSYQKHQRTHSGEKPYVCQTCGQAFTQASNLKRHERVHRGEKPHTCEICGKDFVTSSNLKQHFQTHLEIDNRSKFKCELCGKEYNYNSSLKKHLKTHHNVVSPSSSSVPKYEGFNENFGNMEMSTENFAPQTNYALELDPIPELYQTSNEEFFNTNNNKIEDFNGQNYENYYLDPKSLKENELAPELETVKSFQIYHGGHVDLLENCNLTHVNENGLVEQHKIPRSEENPVGCKPLKEITHISSLVEFLSQYQKPIQEKALNITFDTIINSCNILTCSKIKQDISQKEPLTINDASFADLYNEMMRCECLAMLGPNKSLYPQLNGSEQKQQDIFNFVEKNKTKIENCLCEETMFMKHIHNASCGHPKVFHDDHYDYIVDGRLHHVHGNHCDDHGKVLIVE